MILYSLIANVFICLLSLVGVATILLNKKLLNDILIFFVALAAGTMLGSAFLHLIPESVSQLDISKVNITVLVSFIFFFILERLVHWHHHHSLDDVHSMGIISLAADAIHNFLDGLIITSAFYVNFNLGLVTSVAVILHEIPQELGDFGVLLHSGFNIKKALFANLLVAFTSILGVFAGYFLLDKISFISPYISAFAAGGFIYLSTSDLVPEIKNEDNLKKSWLSFLVFCIGIVLIFFL